MIGKFKFLAVAGVHLAMVAVCSSVYGALRPEEIYEAVLPSTLTLEVENGAGQHFVASGFLALGEGLAVTSWHVVHDAQRVQARFSDDRRATVTGLIDKNEELDLALIQLEPTSRPRITLNPITPRVGSRIYVVGAPRGLDFSLSDGLISQIRTLDRVRYYQVSCPISPGDSGGPVVDERGQVVGVMSWRKTDAEGVSFAIPAADIARLNPARPLVRWAAAKPVVRATDKVSDATRSGKGAARATAPGSSGGFDDFRHLLSSRAGRRVTVTVQEEDAPASHFSFEVPAKALP